MFSSLQRSRFNVTYKRKRQSSYRWVWKEAQRKTSEKADVLSSKMSFNEDQKAFWMPAAYPKNNLQIEAFFEKRDMKMIFLFLAHRITDIWRMFLQIWPWTFLTCFSCTKITFCLSFIVTQTGEKTQFNIFYKLKVRIDAISGAKARTHTCAQTPTSLPPPQTINQTEE